MANLKAVNKQNKDNKLIPKIYPIKKKLSNNANGKINKYTNGTEDINKRKVCLHGNLINNLKPVEPYTNLCLKKCLKFLSL